MQKINGCVYVANEAQRRSGSPLTIHLQCSDDAENPLSSDSCSCGHKMCAKCKTDDNPTCASQFRSHPEPVSPEDIWECVSRPGSIASVLRLTKQSVDVEAPISLPFLQIGAPFVAMIGVLGVP